MRSTKPVSLLLAAAGLVAAQPPPSTPTFRTGTQLVQIRVVAQDREGKPVTDLRREDFQLFDNGAQQEIRLFVGETDQAKIPPPPTQPNTFTNRVAPGSGPHSGYSVIVFDTLFTSFACETGGCGTAWAAQKAIKMLHMLPAGDNIAIYATGYRLWVIRDFTTDTAALERQLRTWKPAMDVIPAVNRPDHFKFEVGQIAEQLAGIPGRKNLIWIADRFPFNPVSVQKLKLANVALYPVDAAGSTIALRTDKLMRSAPLFALAAMTGGVAYSDRDDLEVAIREAIEDGRAGYTLGFYQPGEDLQPATHQLSVRVSRPGIVLRYRNTYQSEPSPTPRSTTVKDLVAALDRPVEATAIPITASATRSQDRLDLTATFDAAHLGLEPSQGRWKAKAELVARFTGADGRRVGDVVSQTAVFNLRPATYAAVLQNGLVYHQQMKIPPKAVELKLMLANMANGEIGTLTIPLSEVRPAM